MSLTEPISLDADSLERVLDLVAESSLQRAVHTARLVDRSWNEAVNSRAHRLREASNCDRPADLAALLTKAKQVTSLDVAYSSFPAAACAALAQLQLTELHLADCTELQAKDLECLSHLTALQSLRLSKPRGTASTVLEGCAKLTRLQTLELKDFSNLQEKLLTNLTPLTELKTLTLIAEDVGKASLGSLCMHLLPACVGQLTYLELGKVESTYPLAALRELSGLKVLSLTNCKPFLKPDATGHDLLVEMAHLTQLSGLSLRQFAARPTRSSDMLQDMRQLKGLKSLHVQQGNARAFVDGLSALTGLVDLVLLDPLNEIQSRHVLNEVLLGLFHLSRLELSVTGDVLVEGFRLFRHLPFLQKLKIAGLHSHDTKGVSNLFWGLTKLTGPVNSLSLRDARFTHAIAGRYRTGAGALVNDLDLGEFPIHSLQVFANVFPSVKSLRLILVKLQQLPLRSWAQLAHVVIDWQPEIDDIASACPLGMCESLSSMPALRQLTVECLSVAVTGPKSSAGAHPFVMIANKHNDMLRMLPGVDVVLIQRGADLRIQAS